MKSTPRAALSLFEDLEAIPLTFGAAILNKERFIEILKECNTITELDLLKNKVLALMQIIVSPRDDREGILNIDSNGDIVYCTPVSQALTNPTSFGLPRRTANGVDFNRLLLITAVLSKRTGLKLGNQDIMVNVTGGLKIGEPAADLGIALAITSSFRDAAVDPELAVVGEVGLSGELRAVAQLDRRVNEAARLGFKRCLVPKAGATVNLTPKNIELIPVSTLREAIRVGLVGGKTRSEAEQDL